MAAAVNLNVTIWQDDAGQIHIDGSDSLGVCAPASQAADAFGLTLPNATLRATLEKLLYQLNLATNAGAMPAAYNVQFSLGLSPITITKEG